MCESSAIRFCISCGYSDIYKEDNYIICNECNYMLDVDYGKPETISGAVSDMKHCYKCGNKMKRGKVNLMCSKCKPPIKFPLSTKRPESVARPNISTRQAQLSPEETKSDAVGSLPSKQDTASADDLLLVSTQTTSDVVNSVPDPGGGESSFQVDQLKQQEGAEQVDGATVQNIDPKTGPHLQVTSRAASIFTNEAPFSGDEGEVVREEPTNSNENKGASGPKKTEDVVQDDEYEVVEVPEESRSESNEVYAGNGASQSSSRFKGHSRSELYSSREKQDNRGETIQFTPVQETGHPLITTSDMGGEHSIRFHTLCRRAC